MTIEERIRMHFSNSERKYGDSPMAFALEIIEQCAQIAENHGSLIGENCWNHENRRDLSPSTCWQDIASAIRSLVLEAERKE